MAIIKATPIFALLIILISCDGDSSQQPQETEGSFQFLTYNVSGLPVVTNGRDPEQNIPQMSPLFNSYDFVVLQEDFFYHDLLRQQVTHRYQSEPKAEGNAFLSSDGLNRFSRFPFGRLTRVTWTACSGASGFDCNAQKGFSVAETEITGNAKVMIYNVHLDAGGAAADIAARTAQLDQLIFNIKNRSANKAVIVAGDFNLDVENRPDDLVLLTKILTECNLKDACQEQNCNIELVDRILYRGSTNLQLTLTEWEIDNRFVDSNGDKLSDHFAVRGMFEWTLQ